MTLISGPPPSSTAPDQTNCPGTVEDLHKACQNVFPMYFEGAKVLINKGLSSHFQVCATDPKNDRLKNSGQLVTPFHSLISTMNIFIMSLYGSY